MKVLVTGAAGQLGRALIAAAPPSARVIAVDRAALDIGDAERVRTLVDEAQPTVIVNAAAYTAVDKAETESELAYRVNRDGPAHVAEAACRVGARLIHVSTDYVFDGAKSTPYGVNDRANPLSVYGASKFAGERAVLDRSGGAALIVRTAWVYSTTGKNFLRTMLRLLKERGEVRVVCDQVGTPTLAANLAAAIWRLADLPEQRGICHWTDSGVASWYDFAVAIADVASRRGYLSRPARVIPITTVEYPAPARRPSYALLDKASTWSSLGPGAHWRHALEGALEAGAPLE